MKIREIRPHVFRLAESKAGRETRKALAKLDYGSAAFWQRRRIESHERYRAAEKARARVEIIVDHNQQLQKP
ncbi:hypothetical protein LCGC14_2487020, partial [marine sediment metagenome]